MPFRKSSGGRSSGPSTKQRREHEGRTANHPGVPSGPRNTPHVTVTVPYAPTPTGRAAERKDDRERKRKQERRNAKKIRAILTQTAQSSPQLALEAAKH